MDIASFSVEILSLLFLVAVIAGCLDTLAGGGGLVSIPALILAGLPPLAALGTNKLQGSMGTATATFMMIRKGRISWHEIKPLMLFAFLGASIGTLALQWLDAGTLSFIIPIVLLFIAFYFLISPTPKNTGGIAKLSEKQYKTSVVPAIGFYDGMFGPGTGSFFALAGVLWRGHDLINSTARAKPLNFATNFASLIVFIAAGHVVWTAGLLMMLGQVIGAWLGSHFLYKINPAYLRWIVVMMCTGMLVRYGYSMGWI